MTEVALINGRRLDARFVLLEKLGSGGQGEVWRAHDETRGLDIAIKVVTPGAAVSAASAWTIFEREHSLASRLSHPSILKVNAPQRIGEIVVLPMELATGGDLRRLRGAGYLEIIPVLLDIAQALEHAHDRGVIHRDLKPGNVLFDARGRVKLADFGAAGTTTTSAADARMQGLSPFTASPEQLRGEAPTVGDDIYGLGALAYELLSGYPPYYPRFDIRRARDEPVPPLVPTRQIPPLLQALVMRMLEKDPQDRPVSMREVIDELDTALNDTLAFEFESVGEADAGAAADAGDDEGPDLGLIPDLLIANALVSAPSAKARPKASVPPPPSPQAPARDWPTPEQSAQARIVRERSTKESAARGVAAQEPVHPTASEAVRPAMRADAWIPTKGDIHASGSSPSTPNSVVATLTAFAQALKAQAEPANAAAKAASGHVASGQGAIAAKSMELRAAEAKPTAAKSAEAKSAEAKSAEGRVSQPVQPLASKPIVTHDAVAASMTAQRRIIMPPGQRAAPFATAGLAAVGGGPTISDERPLWETLKLDSVPRVARLEPIRRRYWPIALLATLAAIAVVAFYWLPRYAPDALPIDFGALSRATKEALTPSSPSNTAPTDTEVVTGEGATDSSAETKLVATRENFDRRLAALEARGAGVWGGADFALAKTRAAESVGAHDAGNMRLAQERLTDASSLLDQVDARAPQALAAEIAAGQKALAAGQEELANQAFDLAKRIDPNDKRIADGQRRAHTLSGILPLLADGQNAEAARNYPRAVQDYNQVLSIDPGNEKARLGLARANAAFGDDNYAKAVGAGFAALGAGRIDDAREAFRKARSIRPNGSEANEGLRRVNTASSAVRYTSLRQRAAALEAQERWDEAVQIYDSALQSDSSLAFAQEGKARAGARAELGAELQAMIDRPERLTSPAAREQARVLIQNANKQTPFGPVLRSQVTRLGLLLPEYERTAAMTGKGSPPSTGASIPVAATVGEATPAASTVTATGARSDSAWRSDMDKPVRLSLLSDNATAVAITNIGQFGTFSRREIQLKPGHYTVIGTRDGYRDVYRDITIAPGQEAQTISVSCSDPI